MNTANAIALARAAHARDPELFPSHGYILVFRDAAFGWSLHLDRPHYVKPGAFAVNADLMHVPGAESVFIATDGNDDAGAQRWVRAL